MKLPVLWGGSGGTGFAALPFKPLGLLVLLVVFVFVASESWFLWRLHQLEVETPKANSSEIQRSSQYPPDTASVLDTPQPAETTEQKTEAGTSASGFLQESSPQNSTTSSVTEPATRDALDQRAVAGRDGKSDGPQKPSHAESVVTPAESAQTAIPVPPHAAKAKTGEEFTGSSHLPSDSPNKMGAPVPSFAKEDHIPFQSPDDWQRHPLYADQQVDIARWYDLAEKHPSLFSSRVGKRFARPQEEDDYDDPDIQPPFSGLNADEAALLQMPDVLLAQNNTNFQMQFLSESERKQLSTQRKHATGSSYTWRNTYDNMPRPYPEWPGNTEQESANAQWAAGLTVGMPVPVSSPSMVDGYPVFMGDMRFQAPLPVGLKLPTGYWRERPRRQSVLPGFTGGSSERRLLTEEAENYGNQPVPVEGAEAEQRGPGGDAGPEDGRRDALEQAETRHQQKGAPHVTYSVVGNPLLRREIKESSEKLLDFVSALPEISVSGRDKDGSGGREVLSGLEPKGSAQPGGDIHREVDSPHNSDEIEGSRLLTLADLPEVLFSKPSKSLVRAVESVERNYTPSEKDRPPSFLPMHTPVEVRSLATLKIRTLVFERVLGAGGQGIVLQARDFNNPELKLAVKLFRIRKRKNRTNGPLQEVARLQRRLRWETAILKYAPRDISSYVWSQLAHLVMPLDIVEPVDLHDMSDGDMRYWHQWVLFESFAGDVAQLKQLSSGSPHARLDASKQMFMATLRLHDMGLVHSDIKLANFFISHEGRVFLGDYSLSRPIGDMSPCIEGTIRFLPPENMKCLRDRTRHIKLSSKKDTWSLGIALYKLWCHNYFPFALDTLHGNDIVTRGAAVTKEELDFSNCSRSTPVAMVDLLQRMLDPDSATRPTLRELYESHVLFKESRKTLMLHTLRDLMQE